MIGLEAGTWLTPRDFAPDELRNNFRGWPQAVQKANRRSRPIAPNASAPYSPRRAIHPMMNAVGGTTLHYWAQSWRLNPWDFKVVSETTRRYGAVAHPEGLDGRGLAVRPRGARAVLRQGRVRGRRVRPGRQHQRQDRSARQHLRGRRASAPIRCRRCAAPSSPSRWRPPRASSAGIRSPARPRSTRSRTRTARRCMYHGFCNRGGCHVDAKNSTAVTHDSAGAGDRAPQGRDARARDDDRGRRAAAA